MNCRRCGEALADNWNYCPKCGERIKPITTFVSGKTVPFQSGAIRINIVQSKPQIQQKSDEEPVRLSAEVLEPESELVQEDDGVKVKIRMPGVKTPETISLKRVGESLEINAYTGNKRYFKIINLEKLNVLKKEFINEMLVLTLG